MTLEQKFDNLEADLAQYEGAEVAARIRQRLFNKMPIILLKWNKLTKTPNCHVSLTSLDAIPVVQEFVTSFGMHLEPKSSLAIDDDHYLFFIYPNW